MSIFKRIAACAVTAVSALSLCIFAACGSGDETHTWDDGTVTQEATCTETGIMTYTCTDCGETKTETIPALGHDWDAGVLDETTGITTFTCNRCGATMTSESGVLPGDDSNDVAIDTSQVSKIEVATEGKSNYEVGDTFSTDGWTILVTFKDGTTTTLPLSSSNFTYTEPSFGSTGDKTLNVKCGSVSVRITLKVTKKSYTITFHYNDGVTDDLAVSYLDGDTVAENNATREGYTLYGWYTDADFMEKYEGFGVAASETLDLYALWLEDGKESVTVTFDYDYYGVVLSYDADGKGQASYSYPVSTGATVSKPADPSRTGYDFVKWVDESGSDFDFTAAISADTTIKASWTKTATTDTYTFEAEYLDFTGKGGPAFSGSVTDEGMIVKKLNHNCSNDYAVSYMYKYGNYLDFYIASDSDVEDATFEISLSMEMTDWTCTSDKFTISVNGDAISYSSITFTGVPEASVTADCLDFQWYTLTTTCSLKAGMNDIRLMTTNNDAVTGTTLTATAPIIDAIRFTTSAVLIWDANYGLPVTTNY